MSYKVVRILVNKMGRFHNTSCVMLNVSHTFRPALLGPVFGYLIAG
jgi:hypothetical protein